MIGAVCDFYHPSIGGSQQLCKSVVEFFHSSGKEVAVLTTKDESRKIEDFPYRIFQLDDLNLSKIDNPLKNIFETVIIFADIFSLSLATFQPKKTQNSILVLNLDENVYRWIKQGQNGFTEQNVERLVSKIKSFTSVVSFCKGAPVNKFLEENEIKYKFISNFSRDAAAFNNKNFDLRKILGINEDKKIIINHGLFEERKNQKALIESFIKSKLKKDFCLVFLGNPRSISDLSYYKQCEKIVRENGFKNSIFFLKGSNNFCMISSVLHNADIYMLPSKAEGLPLVLLEAMSAGLPWISTPVGGVPEVLKDCKSGKILPEIQFTEKQLESCVLEILKKSNSSRIEWEKLFTEKIAKEKYLNLLAEKE